MITTPTRVALTVCGCLSIACSGSGEVAPPVVCPTAEVYDPLGSDVLQKWPDALLEVADPDSPTGVVLDASVEGLAWLAYVPGILRDTLPQVASTSGFARIGGAQFELSGPVVGLPASVAESLTSDAAMLWDLTAGERVPFVVETSADRTRVMLQPVKPLRAGTPHLALLLDGLEGEEGGCVGPSVTTAALAAGQAPDPALAAVAGRTRDALATVGIAPERVVAATVYTTHADELPAIAAAERAATETYAWAEARSCEPAAHGYRHCEGSFDAADHRVGGRIAVEPAGTWRLPVSVWLPEGEGPHPVLVFGHGMEGRRQNAQEVLALAAPLGLAVVATDALRHGEHPTAAPTPALAFLGLNLDGEGPPVDALSLRTNFDQTWLDRRQLLRLLTDAPDVDGDGQADLDATRIAYWGISLGGLLGPGLAALAPELDAAIWSVAGGRLSVFATASTEVQQLRPLLLAAVGGDGPLFAYTNVAQSLVDGADPALWAARVLHDRFDGGAAPSVLLPVAMQDTVVPPATSVALARALGAPHVRPVAEPVDPLELADAPLAGNVGGATAGYFQFDRAGDPLEPAGHDLPASEQALHQVRTFLQTWLAGEPVIVDPYDELDTPPL